MDESCEFGSPPWLTVEQVSQRLGESTLLLAAWRNMGHGPPWLQIGSEVRYDEADFTHWMETTRCESPGQTR
jgi:predicted DNA-binding transcriptional regulator AlpA